MTTCITSNGNKVFFGKANIGDFFKNGYVIADENGIKILQKKGLIDDMKINHCHNNISPDYYDNPNLINEALEENGWFSSIRKNQYGLSYETVKNMIFGIQNESSGYFKLSYDSLLMQLVFPNVEREQFNNHFDYYENYINVSKNKYSYDRFIDDMFSHILGNTNYYYSNNDKYYINICDIKKVFQYKNLSKIQYFLKSL